MGFLLSIATFWKGLPAPIRRIIEYAGIVIAVLWAFKVFWLNPHDNKVAAKERMNVTEEIRKAAEAKWQQQYKDLQEQNKNLEDKAASLQESNAALVRSRESIVASLNKTLANIKVIGATTHAQDMAVPDYMLDSILRSVSNELKCSKPGNIGKEGCPSSSNGGGKAANIGPAP